MTRARWSILGAGLLALPFIFSLSYGEQMREPKQRFFIILMGLLLSLEIASRISWTLAAGAALCYVSAYINSGFPSPELLVFSAALGSCLIFAQFKKNDVKIFLEILEASGLMCVVYAIGFQFTGHDPLLITIPGADYHRVSVFFGQHTLYGPFCAATVACALFRKRYLMAAILAAPIPLIDASFTYLSLAVVVSLFLIREFGKKAVIGLAIASALSVAILAKPVIAQTVQAEALKDNGRFAVWRLTYIIAKARPKLGHGFGSFSKQFQLFQSKELRQKSGYDDSGLSDEAKKVLVDAENLRYRSGFFLHPHNELLLVFYEFGIAGVFVVFTIILSFLFFWLIAEDTTENWALGAIFLSFLANSLGNFPFHLIPQALLPLWAFVLVTTERDRSILEP